MRQRSCPHRTLLLGWLVAGALVLGCGDYKLTFGSTDPARAVPNRTRPQLWTLFDMARALGEGTAVAASASFPEGFAPETFLAPRPGGELVDLRIIPAFSEGEPAAYVMPEIWVDFDEVWVQPWYSLVTAWNDRATGLNRLRDPQTGEAAPPVFDVHPRSLFYNPFWLVFYAVVPSGTPIDRYTSAEDIFNDKLPIHPGPPWIYSVRPPQVVLPSPAVHPYLKTPVGILSSAELSWVDNEAMPYFNEGANNFKYDASRLTIEEVPLFILSRRDANGDELPIPGAAHVIGTGPLLARRPADAPAKRPRFGSLTRFHITVAPATAAAFRAESFPEARALLEARQLAPAAYEGRVAANALPIQATDRGCFGQADFPAGCRWLDSQAAIEDQLGVINIRRTEVLACSPVVFYGGVGVGR
jgi:hypothetical protein